MQPENIPQWGLAGGDTTERGGGGLDLTGGVVREIGARRPEEDGVPALSIEEREEGEGEGSPSRDIGFRKRAHGAQYQVGKDEGRTDRQPGGCVKMGVLTEEYEGGVRRKFKVTLHLELLSK